MSYSFRDKPRLSDRLRGKSGDEILKELKDQLEQERKMFFDSNPAWSATGTQRRSGFPFDDDIMKRPNMRSRLDDLASRHPEFADHLRNPSWAKEFGDIPDGYFRGPEWVHGVRNRHASGGSTGFEDDTSGTETRSQASGSSNASGSSTFSEGEGVPIPVRREKRTSQSPQQQSEKFEEHPPVHAKTKSVHSMNENSSNPSDFQQHQANEQNRSQRSMSAPPDNRVQSNEPRRYISRVEINPVNPQASHSDHNIPQPDKQSSSIPSPGKPPMPPKHGPGSPGTQQQQLPKQGNVRHIPIFVEGRDEPVIAKDFAGNNTTSGAPPQPPPFGRPQFTQYHQFGQPQSRTPPQPQQFKRPNSSSPPPHAFQPKAQAQQQQAKPQPQQFPRQQSPQPQQFKQPPKPPELPKDPVSKDPISKVEAIQKEVEALMQQVEKFTGSKSDKEYMYLDEMLTRHLISLDDIDTEGKDNVRQARKQAIHSVQRCISFLESKAQAGSARNANEEATPTSASTEEVPNPSQDTDNETTNQGGINENKAENMEVERSQSGATLAESNQNNPEETMEVERCQSSSSVNGKIVSELKKNGGSENQSQEQKVDSKITEEAPTNQCGEAAPIDGCEQENASGDSSGAQQMEVDKSENKKEGDSDKGVTQGN